MDLSKKKCSECGKKSYSKKEIIGFWDHPWKDFPCVFILENISIWACIACGNIATIKGDSERLDKAIESSIRTQTARFIDVIRVNGEINSERLSEIIGISSSYLASLHQMKKTPSFTLWNELKAIAIAPKEMLARLEPSWDFTKSNLIRRA